MRADQRARHLAGRLKGGIDVAFEFHLGLVGGHAGARAPLEIVTS
jgi:hypothetical protein